MLQFNRPRWPTAFLALLAVAIAAPAQTSDSDKDETLDIFAEHPRLILRAQRLKLLRREKERRSQRWQQFETLVAGKAPMPEMGFALALYYQASEDTAIGKQAVQWALSPAAIDLRQLSLVFDWCQEVLTPPQSKALAAKLEKGIAASLKDQSIPAARNRTLAAIALAGHLPKVSAAETERVVRSWWRGYMVPALKGGRNLVPREHVYALFELLHAIRDNVNIDLRDPVPGFFKGLPIFHLLSYYPATFAAPEGEYRIPVRKGGAEPDPILAAMSRAAELCMVAYDTNAPETQVLQGWLMHDVFLLRGTFGITYEFLWANPYQPGLSYYHVPLSFHDDMFGRLFVRSSWEEGATWFGYFDGEMQLFQDGRPTVLNPQLVTKPIELDEALILFGSYAEKFKVKMNKDEQLFVIALKPRQAYEIEVDDEEMREEISDPGGILTYKLPVDVEVGVRMRARPARR